MKGNEGHPVAHQRSLSGGDAGPLSGVTSKRGGGGGGHSKELQYIRDLV